MNGKLMAIAGFAALLGFAGVSLASEVSAPYAQPAPKLEASAHVGTIRSAPYAQSAPTFEKSDKGVTFTPAPYGKSAPRLG